MQSELRVLQPEEYFIEKEPYHEPVGDEITVFEAAYRNGLPVLLKGPTGCGKTRFMEHMAWRLKRPLITVSCHDDLTSSDLVGRFLVKGGETIWVDGPLARSVRAGGICYLDEIVEKESGIDAALARQLVKFAHMTRNLKGQGLDEGASTRLLVHAAKLIKSDVDPVVACRSSIAQALTDDVNVLSAA